MEKDAIIKFECDEYNEAMSANFEDTMNVEIKHDPDDIVEDELITQNITVKEEPMIFQEDILPFSGFSDQDNIYEENRHLLVEKMLSKDYEFLTVSRPINFVSKGSPFLDRRTNEKTQKMANCLKRKGVGVPEKNIYDLPCTQENCRKLFKGIFGGSVPPPKLPTKAWSFHKTETPDETLVFTEVGFFGDQGFPQVRKLISFDKEMNAKIYVDATLVLQREINYEKRNLMSFLKYFLSKVNSYKICLGGPPASKFTKINPTYAYRGANVWRHRTCKIIIQHCRNNHNYLKSPLTTCVKCMDLEKTLEQHVDLINI